MASQVYFDGDWYNCISATTAGQSPSTDPDKWAKLEIPKSFERFLIQQAYEFILPAEGQNSKRIPERMSAVAIRDELWLREGAQVGRAATARSTTYTR